MACVPGAKAETGINSGRRLNLQPGRRACCPSATDGGCAGMLQFGPSRGHSFCAVNR